MENIFFCSIEWKYRIENFFTDHLLSFFIFIFCILDSISSHSVGKNLAVVQAAEHMFTPHITKNQQYSIRGYITKQLDSKSEKHQTRYKTTVLACAFVSGTENMHLLLDSALTSRKDFGGVHIYFLPNHMVPRTYLIMLLK